MMELYQSISLSTFLLRLCRNCFYTRGFAATVFVHAALPRESTTLWLPQTRQKKVILMASFLYAAKQRQTEERCILIQL
jgi:hypothetical protein